jgi:hypothetical protein
MGRVIEGTRGWSRNGPAPRRAPRAPITGTFSEQRVRDDSFEKHKKDKRASFRERKRRYPEKANWQYELFHEMLWELGKENTSLFLKLYLRGARSPCWSWTSISWKEGYGGDGRTGVTPLLWGHPPDVPCKTPEKPTEASGTVTEKFVPERGW